MKYKKGDIVKINGSDKWKIIEECYLSGLVGHEAPCYKLRGDQIVSESEIIDVMDALPD